MQVDVAVIGGGAAGFVAAIMAKKHGKWCQIVSQCDITMKALIVNPY